MGQACSMCDSESQGQSFNVDMKDMPGCCDEHVSAKVGKRRKKDKKEKKEKKEKREKRDKGVKKDIVLSHEAKTPRQSPDQTTKAPEPATEIPLYVARPWSKLPSVGTWLHPHPKATRSHHVAALEVQAGAATVGGSAKALDEQAILAEIFAWAAADEALAKAGAEVPLCPATRKAVFVEGLAAPAATKETSKLEAFDMRSWEEVALAEIFAEAFAATKPPGSPAVVTEEAPMAALLQQPVLKEPLTEGGRQSVPAAWAFKPSVGTWLRARAPVPAAPAAPDAIAEEPLATLTVDAVPLDVPIPFSPPSVLSILATAGACGSPVLGGGPVVSYGPQLPPPIFQDVPVATSLGDKSPPGSTTSTTRSTTTTTGELTGAGPPALGAVRKTIPL